MTKKELLAKLAALDIKDVRQRNSVVCALIGHSRIHVVSFFRHYCARCDQQLGDTLADNFIDAIDAVIVGHDCATCRSNYEDTTWKDRLYVQNPFKVTTPQRHNNEACGGHN